MSTNRFEQLIEYVINDEEAKAKELFHQIVVEKSRAIYEDLMDEEAVEEAEEQEESIEEDNAMGEEPTEIDTDMSEDLGGGQAESMIRDVEVEEEGMSEDDAEFDDGAEEAGKELTHDLEAQHDEGDLEDRVVDLEDKLDELMAEFEALMADEKAEHGDDTPDMTDIEVADDEFETEGAMPMEEAINLKTVSPKTTTQEAPGTNVKSTVAFNSGKTGMQGAPVKMTGDTAQGRPAPTTKDLIGKVGNTPAQSTQEPKAAQKPVTTQAAGVNARSPLPRV